MVFCSKYQSRKPSFLTVYVLRTSIDLHSEKGFTLHKSRSRRCPAVTITHEDYADYLDLFADTFADAEQLDQVYLK